MSVKRTYTIAEAAELTGLSRKAIARRLERGSLRSLVRNGRRLVPRSELVRAGLIPAEGAAPPEPAAAQSPVPGTPDASSPELMLATLMRELLDRLDRQNAELASYRAITAQAESLHLEREVNELRSRLLALEGRQHGAAGPTPPARPEDTTRVAQQPPPQQQPPYAQPPASGDPHGEHPIWLPPSAASAPAPAPPPPPAPQQRAPVYAQPRSSLVGRLLLFALEAGFIVAVAVAAWLSDLEPLVMAGSIGVAWVLVALLEWIRWNASGRR